MIQQFLIFTTRCFSLACSIEYLVVNLENFVFFMEMQKKKKKKLELCVNFWNITQKNVCKL